MPVSRCVSAIKKTLRYSERDYEQRITYLRDLRQAVKERGSSNIVYVDESGFESQSYRPCGWAPIGSKVHGERSGNSRPRTNLIAAHRGQEFIAPMTFIGAAHTELVNAWFEKMLIKELRPNSTIIWDNAKFHSKKRLPALAQRYGHFVLFLPPYSPDFNPIEQDFATIKKHRQFVHQDTTLDDIIKQYNSYLE
jgi:putative transposase